MHGSGLYEQTVVLYLFHKVYGNNTPEVQGKPAINGRNILRFYSLIKIKVTNEFRYNDERFADIQMLRYRLDGFENLSLRQKKLVYYLSQATLAGRDITFDQFGKYNLRIRKMLEAIY